MRMLFKEFCVLEKGNRFILRADTYAKSLQHIENLYQEAKKDFPDLERKEVEVIYYGGCRYARTYGIEFTRPADETPKGYTEVKQVELSK